ncbi:MAG: acyl carrier protein [Chitinivibrionia bacterium]|nr:acyl carrier protein [Chitinivibrionia bacterium]
MRERIKRIMKEAFELSDVPDDISQKNCGKWDSLRHLQLVVDLETEFDVSFEPEDIGSMESLVKIEEKLKLIGK